MTLNFEPIHAIHAKKGTTVHHEQQNWEVGERRENGRIIILRRGKREKVVRGNTMVGRLASTRAHA